MEYTGYNEASGEASREQSSTNPCFIDLAADSKWPADRMIMIVR